MTASNIRAMASRLQAVLEGERPMAPTSKLTSVVQVKRGLRQLAAEGRVRAKELLADSVRLHACTAGWDRSNIRACLTAYRDRVFLASYGLAPSYDCA